VRRAHQPPPINHDAEAVARRKDGTETRSARTRHRVSGWGGRNQACAAANPVAPARPGAGWAPAKATYMAAGAPAMSFTRPLAHLRPLV